MSQAEYIYIFAVSLCLLAGYLVQAIARKSVVDKVDDKGPSNAILVSKKLVGPAIALALVVLLEFASNLLPPQYLVDETVRRGAYIAPAYWLAFRFLSILVESRVMFWLTFCVSATWISVWFLGFQKNLRAYLDGFSFTLAESEVTLYQVLLAGYVFFLSSLVVNFFFKIWFDSTFTTMAQRRRVAIKRKVSLVIYVVITVFMLNSLGFDTASISLLTGGLGIGVGFSLKQVAANFVSGRVIYFQTLLKKGDMCSLEDGSRAIVDEVSTTHIRMTSLAGTSVFIPCEDFMGKRFSIWRKGRDLLMVDMKFDLTYQSNIEKAMDVILKKGPLYEDIAREPRPFVTVAGTADSSIVIRLVFWMTDFAKGTWRTKSAIYRNVIQEFALHDDLEFAYPTRTLFLENDSKGPAAGDLKDSNETNK